MSQDYLDVRRVNKSDFTKYYGHGKVKIRRDIFDKHNTCYMCGCIREKYQSPFEIDHKIPVCFGGDMIGKENLDILCRDCHIFKTKIDRRCLSCCKTLGLVHSSGYFWRWTIIFPLEMWNLYLTLYEKAVFEERKQMDIRANETRRNRIAMGLIS